MLALLYPHRCVVCSAPLSLDERHACAPCLRWFDCPDVPPSPDGIDRHAACVFDGEVRDALHALKFQGQTWRAGGLGALAAATVWGSARHDLPFDAVVPVPLHRTRLRERGFNQSCVLARGVARSLGLPLRVAWLARHDDGAARSAGKTRAAFEDGAFVASPHVHGARVLVVDDVTTTGRTLEAVCSALFDAGADPTATLSIAYTPKRSGDDDADRQS